LGPRAPRTSFQKQLDRQNLRGGAFQLQDLRRLSRRCCGTNASTISPIL
jgi:hypothetical protein